MGVVRDVLNQVGQQLPAVKKWRLLHEYAVGGHRTKPSLGKLRMIYMYADLVGQTWQDRLGGTSQLPMDIPSTSRYK